MPMTVAGRHLESDERIHAGGDRDVEEQRDNRRDRHVPLEPDGDVHAHDHQEHKQRDQRLLR